ncbi:MAG: hypothetical protein AAF449_22120 [Myxococcota bacterium]
MPSAWSSASFARTAQPNRRHAPRVSVEDLAVVRIQSKTGTCTARLRDLSPWSIGLRASSGPMPSVGMRVRVAFGVGRWSISRAAEVRRSEGDELGLTLTDPLPVSLRRELIDRQTPRLVPATAHLDACDDRHVRDWVDPSGVHVGRLVVRRWTDRTWLAHGHTVQPSHTQLRTCWRDFRRFAATLAVYHDGDRAQLLFFREVGDDTVPPVDERPKHPHIDRLMLWTAPLFPGHSSATIDIVPASTLSHVAIDLRRQFGAVVSRALDWDNDGLAAAQNKRPNGGIFEVRTEQGRGYVVVDRPDQPSSAEEDIVWTLTADGDASAVLRGAEVVAARCGLTRATAMGIHHDPQTLIPGQDAYELVAVSAAGLRQFDTHDQRG